MNRILSIHRPWSASLAILTMVLAACAPAAPSAAPTAAPATKPTSAPTTAPAAAATQPAAAAKPTSAPAAAPASGAPIKVGVALPLTGGAAAIGKENLQGIQLAFDEIGNQVAGHPIQLIQADDQNTPDIGLNEVRRLVEDEKVSAVLGSLNSAVALAIHPYTTSKKMPYITGGIAKALTQEQKSPTTIRGSLAAGQQEGPLAYYLYKTAGYRKGIMMGSDYAAGHDAVDATGGAFKSLGGQIVQEVFPRQGETDYSPFFSRIASEQADFVYGYFFGGDTLRFIKQYRELGLSFPLIITGSAVSGGGVDAALGADLNGLISPEVYIWTLETPENQAFVKAYRDKFNADPSTLSYNGYQQGKVFAMAAQKLNGQTEDGLAFAQAMSQVTFQGPAGMVHFDSSNNPILNVLIIRWDVKDGKPVPTVVDKVENVDQTWQPPKT